ncbi:MAG: phosphoglycerate kinase [Peptostreptococcales bacterium]
MMKKSIKDISIMNKKVIVRCDFNVPMDENLNITDDIRIKSSIPTIEYLMDQGATIILLSHLGRPKGIPNKKYSLKPVAKRLGELLGKDVLFVDEDLIITENTKKIVGEMKPGQIALLQNIRFRKEETDNDPIFAEELASLGEIFVNDAFGTVHRAHASTTGITKYLPSVSGNLIKKEIDYMVTALDKPERPFTIILGGSKVGDKIGVIHNLIPKADNIIIGGGMVYTFLKAKGYEVGKSLLEETKVDLAIEILKEAEKADMELIFPVDILVADEFNNDSPYQCVKFSEIPKDKMGLDIGPESIKLFSDVISKSKTVIWNGPMGVFEMSNFAKGTEGIAKAMAENENALTIIGGGDSAAAAEEFGYTSKITHVSTGGGASLKLLEGKALPGIEALDDQ